MHAYPFPKGMIPTDRSSDRSTKPLSWLFEPVPVLRGCAMDSADVLFVVVYCHPPILGRAQIGKLMGIHTYNVRVEAKNA